MRGAAAAAATPSLLVRERREPSSTEGGAGGGGARGGGRGASSFSIVMKSGRGIWVAANNDFRRRSALLNRYNSISEGVMRGTNGGNAMSMSSTSEECRMMLASALILLGEKEISNSFSEGR